MSDRYQGSSCRIAVAYVLSDVFCDVSLTKPRLDTRDRGGILKYETYYKQLDLYYQFSHRMGKIVDEEWLRREREHTESNIMRYLTKGKTNYIALLSILRKASAADGGVPHL